MSSQTEPNIIMIISDQHRGDWMGCAGSRIVDTPNMDSMARQGIQFTRAYCNSPLCVPSRMSMLSGKLPLHNGVFQNDDILGSDIPTFVHALGLGGYETVLCGRMHFVGPDQRHGYQQRLVGDITNCYPGGPGTSYGELEGTSGQGLTSICKAGPGRSPVHQYDEQVIKACEHYLAERSSDKKSPLFLTVGFYGPHHPYTCPADLYEETRSAMEKYDDPIPKDHSRHLWLSEWFEMLGADDITLEQLRVARACYAGNISLVDRYVGRVLKAIESLPGDTWVVYVSDHGDMAGDRGMFWKRNFYEGAVRVPMIWYPFSRSNTHGRISQGLKIRVPVSLLDLAPTFIRIAKAPEIPNIDGKDLSPLLDAEGEATSNRDTWMNRPIFSELVNLQDSATRMVICGNEKLVVHHRSDSPQLFDLDQDPREQRNLFWEDNHKESRDRLWKMLMAEWDGEKILDEIMKKQPYRQYLRAWGKQVGMGPLDLWNYDI